MLVHLGVHTTVEDALAAWPEVVDGFYRFGRDNQADKVAHNV
jgi:hypothetical protein